MPEPVPPPKWVCELKALKAVAALCFFADNIEYGIYQLGSFGVMPFSPVISSAALT